ncbi:MAG: APA family basic amino acid/polyamine antiporter [Myxococcota bacterium]|jgi:APA family basic amino acid/polyamine antiporter
MSTERRIGQGTATLLVVATMVGTGVFTTTGFLLEDLSGPAVLLAWLLGGVSALCGALCYAELAAALPRNGGDYHLLGRIYHPALGFTAGVISLLVGFAAPIAASALAFGAYLAQIWPGVPQLAVGLVLVLALSLLHSRDVGKAMRAQDLLTVPKIVLLAIGAVVGVLIGDPERIVEPGPGEGGAGAFAVGLVFVYYAYSGWNGAAYVAGELRDPARDLPAALIKGTLLVTALYLVANAAFLAAAPPEALAGRVDVAAVAATHLLGDLGGKLVAGVVALGLVSAVGAMIMAGPRIYATMGEDYPRLAVLARRSKGGGPAVAVALQTGLAIVMMLVADIDAIYTYAGLSLSVMSALTVAGVFVLRRTEPDLERPYRTLGYPVTPALFVLFTVWMVYQSVAAEPVAAAVSVGSLLLGLGLWALVRPKPG